MEGDILKDIKNKITVLTTKGMILTIIQNSKGKFFLHENKNNTIEPIYAMQIRDAIITVLDQYAKSISIYPDAISIWAKSIDTDVLLKYPETVTLVSNQRFKTVDDEIAYN